MSRHYIDKQIKIFRENTTLLITLCQKWGTCVCIPRSPESLQWTIWRPAWRWRQHM